MKYFLTKLQKNAPAYIFAGTPQYVSERFIFGAVFLSVRDRRSSHTDRSEIRDDLHRMRGR